ncbi:MAG: hypothetical protein KBF37_02375 [Saprospiraceae bacterium]|jgi:hypothetical protein|nr:hypothetical protein [Saprospiraceae bacterium]MBP9209144.1 hypothetical protein [Saprospiraceae bacterium]MBV6473625.1 hypothetical protein [Saprospiraceae bacterium]
MKKSLLLSLLLLALGTATLGQNLFTEDFDFGPLDSLEKTHGWERSGVNGPYNIAVTAPGLEYPGYVGSGRGNTCLITNSGEGDVLLHSFASVNSGSLYLSFMFRVDSLPSTSSMGYGICFNPGDGRTSLNTQLYIKRLSDSSFSVGTRKYEGLAKHYSNDTFSTGQTYLAVLKYQFVAGADNDTSSLYLFQYGVPAAEPPMPLVSSHDGPDFINMAFVVLTNNYAQSPLFDGVKLRIDGIRVGTSWQSSVWAMPTSVHSGSRESLIPLSNVPNPFRSHTSLQYELPSRGWVLVQLLNASGQLCGELHRGFQEAGVHHLLWERNGLPAGQYTCRLLFNNEEANHRMLLLD